MDPTSRCPSWYLSEVAHRCLSTPPGLMCIIVRYSGMAMALLSLLVLEAIDPGGKGLTGKRALPLFGASFSGAM